MGLILLFLYRFVLKEKENLNFSNVRDIHKLGTVAYTFNSALRWQAEAGIHVPGQPGLHSETRHSV